MLNRPPVYSPRWQRFGGIASVSIAYCRRHVTSGKLTSHVVRLWDFERTTQCTKEDGKHRTCRRLGSERQESNLVKPNISCLDSPWLKQFVHALALYVWSSPEGEGCQQDMNSQYLSTSHTVFFRIEA